MNSARHAALEMLRSPDFFAQLRGALARAGLAGEEKIGVGVFFTIISRFRPNPLRVAIREVTEGGAEYVVRCVSKLLERGTVCGVCPEHRWLRFSRNPIHRVAYVRQWSDALPEGIRFETNGNRLARVTRRIRDGRIVETPEIIEGRFACFAEQYPWESPDRLRWLTIQLPAPPLRVPYGIKALDNDEIDTWRDVQRLLQERAKRKVVLPDWAGVVAEQIRDERGARYLPVFVRAWQTMAMLRSFRQDGCGDEVHGGHNVQQASFEDLAVTSLLVRRVFREGSWFPSPAKVFNRIFPVGEERAVINPVTGKGVRYTRREDKSAPWDFVSLDVM